MKNRAQNEGGEDDGSDDEDDGSDDDDDGSDDEGDGDGSNEDSEPNDSNEVQRPSGASLYGNIKILYESINLEQLIHILIRTVWSK